MNQHFPKSTDYAKQLSLSARIHPSQQQCLPSHDSCRDAAGILRRRSEMRKEHMFNRNLTHLFSMSNTRTDGGKQAGVSELHLLRGSVSVYGRFAYTRVCIQTQAAVWCLFLSVSPLVSGGALWMITSKHECLLCSLKLQETWLPSPKLPFWICILYSMGKMHLD